MASLADLFVRIRPDDRQVNASLANVKRSLTDIDRTRARPKVEMPEAERAVASLQAKLQGLSRTRVKLSIDSQLATAEVGTLQRQLQRLTTQRNSVPVHLQAGIDQEIASVQRQLAVVTKRQTSIPMRLERIDGQVSATKSMLDRLERDKVNIPVSIDDDQLAAQAADARRTLARQLSRGAEVEGAGRQSGGRFGRAFSAASTAGLAVVGGALAGVVAAAGGAAVAAGAVGVKTAAGLETAKIGFETMLGSAEKADKFLRDLADFAARTPFEFPDLQRSASQLVAIGLNAEDVIPIMTTLGDITAGMGTGSEGIKRAVVAIQQMNAAQRITAEDLNQLRDAGVPVFELLAKATGKSTKEIAAMAQSGKLGKRELDALMTTLKSGEGLERFSGLMSKTSQSMSGLWATLKDTFSMGMAQAIAPAVPIIKDGLGGAIKFVGAAMPAIASGLTAIGRVIGPVGNQIKGLFDALKGGGGGGGAASSLSGIGAAFKGLLATVLPIARQIGAAIAGVLGGSDGAGATMAALKDTIVSGLTFIKTYIETVTKVIRFIWATWGDDITATVQSAWGLVIPLLRNAFQVIGGIFKIGTALMTGDWSGVWDGMSQILTAWGSSIKLIFGAIWGGIKAFFAATWGQLIGILRDNVMEGLRILNEKWGQIKTIIAGGLTAAGVAVAEGWGRIRAATTSALTTVWNAIKTGVNLWLTPLKVVFTLMASIVIIAWQGIRKVTSAAWEAIYGAVLKPVWDKITNLFRSATSAVWGVITAWLTKVRKYISDGWNWVHNQVIKPVWDKIKNTFTSVSNSVRAGVTAFIDRVKAIIRAGWNWVYDSVVRPVWIKIRDLFASVQSTVTSRWDSFWTRIKRVGSDAMASVKRSIDTVLGRIKDAFNNAQSAIGRIWDKVKAQVSTPIRWVVNNVYNKPLVPVWNRVASLVDGPKLKAYARGGIAEAERYANGGTHGVRPGYTPGRDTHLIGVGGGEAIMRPEWTRAAGKAYVDEANRVARTRGVAGIRELIKKRGLPGRPGLISTPLHGDVQQQFAGGGIVGWVRNALGSAASAVKGLASKLKGWALGGLEAAAKAAFKPIRGLINSKLRGNGVNTTTGKIANKALDLIVSKIGKSDAAALPDAGPGGGPSGDGGLAPQGGGQAAARRAAFRIMGTYGNTYPGHLPSMNKARDFPGSVAQQLRLAAHLRANHAKYGIMYIISRMRIASARGNWAWRPYHPISNRGDFRHIYHVHASFYKNGGIVPSKGPAKLADGGIVQGGRGGVLAHIGEGKQDELVTPLPRGWQNASGGGDLANKVDRLCTLIEANGLNPPQFNFGDIVNPAAEAPSVTINKTLQRVAAVGLVG